MITKHADYVLNAHQQRVIDKLEKNPGVVARHAPGSGKTLTSLVATERYLKNNPKKKALFLVPASLVNNIYKEIDKHGVDIPRDRIHVTSYEKAVNSPELVNSNDYGFVVSDEAHKLRNTDTKKAQMARRIFDHADKRLLMTGTADYNLLRDVAPLVNMAAADAVLPTGTAFDKHFLGEKPIPRSIMGYLRNDPIVRKPYLKNKTQLMRAVRTYVDNHNIDMNSADFPKKRERVVQVEMDPKQKTMYKFLEGDIPESVRVKINKGLPLSKQELKEFNTFATGIRQASNSIRPYEKHVTNHVTPKMTKAVEALEQSMKTTPNFKGVVYSNYLDAGLRPYEDLLKQKGIDYSMFTGSLTAKQKKELVDAYNSMDGKPKVMLLSSSGGEGLDLQGVRKVQVLEPHFNKSKIDQVVSRAVRYKSHAHLPEDQRNVDVEYYQSVYPRSFLSKLFRATPDMSIDTYLHNNSADKYALGNEVFNR